MFRNLKVLPSDFKVQTHHRLYLDLEQPMAIVSLTGWVASLEDGTPELDAHFSASTVMGDSVVTLGGHLTPGTVTSIKVVVVIGVIEESVKLLPFLLIVRFVREFDEPIDGIIYASFIALGFAAVENLRYLEFLTTREAFARGFAGPMLHIVFASIWGYYVGRAWLRHRAVVPTVFAALGASAFVHGVYNFVVIGLPAPWLPVSAGLIVGLWIWRLRLIRDLHAAYRRGTRPDSAQVG